MELKKIINAKTYVENVCAGVYNRTRRCDNLLIN